MSIISNNSWIEGYHMKDIHAFVTQLKDAAFREEIAVPFSQLEEGDWTGVVQLAARYGYTLSTKELKTVAAANPGFFKGAGKNPSLGWDASMLSAM
ncbi:hypothetical protein Cpha266_2381 [Chlorobium phaeobacteroides DSM 266]|jgi:hypothetical protein|uniref:Nif11 domain-containing protein n=2 Tax=Chlorobium phaeobacteroides TaxID=1096 RepID=A1BIZ2_CHLPD|nr:hypothetical protein Cpha266_2381 [Chlorobium phaeobacteroides DSM 266]